MSGKAQQTTLSAIGNISGVPAEMKQSELKAVLMGETQRWKNGKRVVIALMKTNTPLGKTTSSKVYDMSGDELNKYWLSLVFQGKSQAPVFFTSVTDLQNFVSQNPGAIGIIDKPIASAEIRSVIIDGKTSF
jgi:F0F1-type ATP synthase beta subunit